MAAALMRLSRASGGERPRAAEGGVRFRPGGERGDFFGGRFFQGATCSPPFLGGANSSPPFFGWEGPGFPFKTERKKGYQLIGTSLVKASGTHQFLAKQAHSLPSSWTLVEKCIRMKITQH